MDLPAAADLRRAIESTRATLAERGEDEARYLERVAANLEAILEREASALDPAIDATIAAFAALLPDHAPMPSTSPRQEVDSLRRSLDDGLRSGELRPSAAVHRALLDDARRRLSIARPGYEQQP